MQMFERSQRVALLRRCAPEPSCDHVREWDLPSEGALGSSGSTSVHSTSACC